MDDHKTTELNEALELKKAFESGANWFFWITGLSIINSAVILMENDWGFALGLGMTQLVDALALQLSPAIGSLALAGALAIDVFLAGLFAAFGYFARKGQAWAFIIGMAFYGFDALIYLLVFDFVGIGLHILVLFFIFKGFKAVQDLKRLAVNGTGEPPSLAQEEDTDEVEEEEEKPKSLLDTEDGPLPIVFPE